MDYSLCVESQLPRTLTCAGLFELIKFTWVQNKELLVDDWQQLSIEYAANGITIYPPETQLKFVWGASKIANGRYVQMDQSKQKLPLVSFTVLLCAAIYQSYFSMLLLIDFSKATKAPPTWCDLNQFTRQ